SSKHLKHLSFPLMGWFVRTIDLMVHRHRPIIYVTAAVVTFFAVMGMMRLHSISYIVDDIPEESQIKKDLKFFESNFSGVMPLEITIELKTKRRRPLLDVANIQAIDRFESSLDSITVTSRPVSIVSFIKAAKQAFYNNNPDRYELPTRQESGFILRYMKGQSDNRD